MLFASTKPGSEGVGIDKRTGQSYSDIWISTRDVKGKWDETQLLTKSINTEHNEGTPVMTTIKDRLYFTRCNVIPKKNIGCDIYYSDKIGSTWSEAKSTKIKPEGADSLSVGHPAISNKGDIMIFSSDLPGGSGGKDLWYSNYDKKDKTWGTPINLGPTINTSGDEVFPHFDKDNVLHFSSNGHPGIGGLDLFKTSSEDFQNWTQPVNLNYPMNSSKDQSYYT